MAFDIDHSLILAPLSRYIPLNGEAIAIIVCPHSVSSTF